MPGDAGASGAPRFPPQVLREYALLADGERGALIGPHGELAWMCLPRWDSEAVFASLVGGPGGYAVAPVGRYVWGGYYEEGSLIWRSRWVTGTGIVECREALSFPGETSRVVLLRRIEAVHGDARMRVLLDVRPGFGRWSFDQVSCRQELWTGQAGPVRLRWSGAAAARPRSGDPVLDLELTVPHGCHHDLVLELADRPLPDRPVDAAAAWAATEEGWCRAVPDLSGTVARRDARQSCAVLHGLTSGTGGMVAAATLGLPEHADQGRDYDYRYVWIRDQCFAGQAAAAAGVEDLLDTTVGFVSARLLDDGPRLRPAYTVTGQAVPDQRALPLPGYPGGRAVTGNRASRQFQLDTLGEALLLLATAAREDRLDSDGWRAAEVAVAAIEQRWTDPDAGLWELDDQHWTESRLVCVAGLRAIARTGTPCPRSSGWSELADRILTRTSATCLHPSGRWQRAASDERLDAALLMPALRGGLAAHDPRTVATHRALLDELADDFFLYRYRHQAGPLHRAEGAFLLCGFMMALSCQQQGDPVAAHRWFERNRSACGPAGLFSEEFDVVEHQLRGNLPQAFVHALMLETAARLAR